MLGNTIVLGQLAGWLNTWMTPIWLLGLGTLVGLVVLLLCWGVLRLVSPKTSREVPLMVSEGPLMAITWVAIALAVLGIVGSLVVQDRSSIFRSITRLPNVGAVRVPLLTIPAAAPGTEPEPQQAAVTFRGDELKQLEIESTENLLLSTPVQDEEGDTPLKMEWEVDGGQEFVWSRMKEVEPALAGIEVPHLLITNLGGSDAKVRLTVTTAPENPQVLTVMVTAAVLVGLYLLYFLLRMLFPKISAIGLATVKSEMAQPLFSILMGLGLFLLLLFLFIPYNTFGEDIKVLKDSGLTLIMVFCIVQAVWAASNSVAEEIENKTALTLLSKPIGRREFVLGKFLGISWTTIVLYFCLGMFFLVVVAYKPIYDARETSKTAPDWQECHSEMVLTVPGLVLGFFETLVFSAIGVAISTRWPLLVNIIVCFAIYAFGHLTPQLVQTGEGKFENVKFMAQFIATVLPVLDHFNINAAVAAGAPVPMSYVGMAAVYCAIYCTIAMLLALVLFEDRDLA